MAAPSIVELLRATLDPKTHREAETALRAAEQNPGFSIQLLEVTASETHPLQDRLASALCFKNLIKRNWTDPDGNYKLPENEVTTIKTQLIGLMISTPPTIQAQLGEAVSVIAESDFYERWPTLVDDLVSKFTPDNPVTNNGVLQVAHSIFQRWRPLFRTDELFTEINYVLSKFGGPFVSLLVSTDRQIELNKNDKTLLHQHFAALDTEFQLLNDLSCQDLPPIFEENLTDVSGLLQKYLQYDNALLHTDDDAEAGILEKTKSSLFEILTLFVQKYEDVFGQYIPTFIQSSWELLTTLDTQTKYDTLASKAMNFLTSISKIKLHAEAFNNDETLSRVVEGVILPNITLRESDVELFEDEPIEFIRRDLEGTDTETRRRAATDFLRELMGQFQERVSALVMRYVNHYLEDSVKNTETSWKSKDTAVYLFCSIAAVGAVTTTHGVQTTNPYTNVIEFFTKNIAHDLVSDASHVLLQVDAIKYLYTFRRQITTEQWQEVFPMLVRHLVSDNYVVHTYCAIAIDRVLLLSGDGGQSLIPRVKLQELSQRLLQQLFILIEKDAVPEKVQENEFLMRCVMRILIVMKEDITPHVDFVTKHLVSIVNVIRHNPSNPQFYYYLFEAMGALIKAVAPLQPHTLETQLYEPFAAILSQDIQEFTPYIFQLFAALLESNPSASLSDYYQNLVQPVLAPVLWESRGNTPALVRLLSSFIARGAPQIAANNQVEQILGVWRKLNNSYKANETSAYDLLESVVTNFSPEVLSNYFNTIFSILFTRLSNSPSENYSQRFARLYHLMSARSEQGLGPDVVISLFEAVKTGIFAEMYPRVILPNTMKLSRPIDRKIAVLSLTKTLADSNTFAEKFKVGWARACEAMLKLMLDPPKPAPTDNVAVEHDVEDLSFGVGFTQLNTCRRAPQDPFPEIQDLKPWIGQYLKEADSRHGGRIGAFIQERLPAETQSTLISYMQS